MKTQQEIRESFWQCLKEVAPELHSQRSEYKTQNNYCADIRCNFVDYVDMLQRDGIIHKDLAKIVTL